MKKVEILRPYFEKTMDMKSMSIGEHVIYDDDDRALELQEKGYVKVISESKVPVNKKSKLKDG